MLFAHPLSLANWAPTSPTQPQGQLPQSLTHLGNSISQFAVPMTAQFPPAQICMAKARLFIQKKSVAAEAIMLNAGGVSGSRGWEEGAGGVSGGSGWRVGAGVWVGAGGGGWVLGVWVGAGVGAGCWGCEWGQGVGAGGVSGGRGWVLGVWVGAGGGGGVVLGVEICPSSGGMRSQDPFTVMLRHISVAWMWEQIARQLGDTEGWSR